MPMATVAKIIALNCTEPPGEVSRRIVEPFEFHEALIVIQRNQSLQSRPVRFAGLFLCFSYSNIAFPYVFSIAQGDGVRTYIVHFVREQVGDFLKTAVDGQVDILLCRSTRGCELSYGSGRALPFGRPQPQQHMGSLRPVSAH